MTIETPAWVRDAVFYQVFPDRLARSGRVDAPGELQAWDAEPTVGGFKGGDLYGVVEHLDRLQRLGITALYLNPVFASASNHRYHTDDYFAVDPLLGGDDALRALLDEAHSRGMRVVLDGVFNHCGRGWWPFHHVAENGSESPYRDWFYLADDVRDGRRGISPYPTAGQLAKIADLRASGAAYGEASRAVLGYEAWWDLSALPKLDLQQPQLRELILDVSEHWIRFGIDGWRLDVAEEVEADFWREFRTRVRSADPEAYLVAEVWHHKPAWLQGDMFDAFMNYPLALGVLGFAAQGHLDHGVRVPAEYEDKLAVFDGASLWACVEELATINGPAVTAAQLNLLDSHDTPRALTICGGDLDSLRLATLLQMTLPGAPCVYYGDEIGMAGTMDPMCRRAFPADPAEWEREPYAWVADTIALRHSSPAFRDAELSLLGAQGAALAYQRRADDEVFAVVVNAGGEPLSWELGLPLEMRAAELVPLRGGRRGTRSVELEGQALRVTLPERDGVVIRLRP